MAHLSETAVFMELGLAVFGLHAASAFRFSFILWSLLFCLLGRFLNVYPLSLFVNKVLYPPLSGGSRPATPPLVRTRTQHMLFFSGLRGAVAFACATTFPDKYGNRDAFIATTMALVLATVFVMGGMTEDALGGLGVPVGVEEGDFGEDSLPVSDRWAGCARGIGGVNDFLYRRLVKPDYDGGLLDGSTRSDGGHGDLEMSTLGSGDTKALVSSENSSNLGAYDIAAVGGPVKVAGAAAIEEQKPTTKRTAMRRRQSSATLFDFGGKKSEGAKR